jgi:uncharacterized phage-associated protein
MTTAHDVAVALRERLPGIGEVKLHKLLYYCQGVHLAHCGDKIFDETISAWDLGPVIGTLWRDERSGRTAPDPQPLTNAQLSTVGYVVSRYGALSGRDLMTLTHNEDPWKRGDEERRRRGVKRARIRIEWINEFFSQSLDEDEPRLNPDVVREWLSGITRPRQGAKPDTYEALAAWPHRGA